MQPALYPSTSAKERPAAAMDSGMRFNAILAERSTYRLDLARYVVLSPVWITRVGPVQTGASRYGTTAGLEPFPRVCEAVNTASSIPIVSHGNPNHGPKSRDTLERPDEPRCPLRPTNGYCCGRLYA
ncbi:MAG: hypothetical protein ACREX4_13270 [Gammaproteobacteria bacterium]